MLTRRQIQRLAQRHGIGLHAQERDYLQHLILFELYNHTQAFIFKDGTALRLAYQGNRYSEDLDFNAPPDSDAAQVATQWQVVLDELSAFREGGHRAPPLLPTSGMAGVACPTAWPCTRTRPTLTPAEADGGYGRPVG